MDVNELGYVPVQGWRAVRRCRCEDCDGTFLESEILNAPNPFNPDDTICGCPRCKSVTAFALLCDFPGCDEDSSCGEPTSEGGYVHRCSKHSLWRLLRPDPPTDEFITLPRMEME